MNCKNPMKVKQSKMHTQNGKRQYIRQDAPILHVGCGKCLWCRIQRRREWTLRLLFESENYTNKWFVTLTYDTHNNPSTIIKRDLQLFIKRLRKTIPNKIRYYAVGEYGEQTARPHYHIILFGPSEKDLQATYIDQLQKYQSKTLKETWTLGNHDLGNVTIESIQYVAGYVHKKLYGKDKYPQGMEPPFALMSKLIGYNYFVKNQNKYVTETGALLMRGKQVNIPRSYIRKMQRENDKLFDIKKFGTEEGFQEFIHKNFTGANHTETLKKIKSRGQDNYLSRLYHKLGVGHPEDLTPEDYQKLDRLQKADAEAVDYYLKQHQKNQQGKSKL